MSEGIIDAFITNLGMYNEGELRGEYLSLPASKDDVQKVLHKAGIDGILYEEFFITDYDTDVPGLYDVLGEYENIDELNYLASVLDDLSNDETEMFEAAIEYGEYTGSVKDLINLAQNLDHYDLLSDINDDEDLGRYYIDECGSLEVPDYLQNYIDYETYGRDIRFEEGGCFTNNGYMYCNNDRFTEYYNGDIEEIPDEYRIFSYTEQEQEKPSVLAALEGASVKAAHLPKKDMQSQLVNVER